MLQHYMTGSTIVGISLSKSRFASPYAPIFVSWVSMCTTCVEVYDNAQVSLYSVSVVYGLSNSVMISLGTFLYFDVQKRLLKQFIAWSPQHLQEIVIPGQSFMMSLVVVYYQIPLVVGLWLLMLVYSQCFFSLGLWNYLVTMIARSAVTNGYGMVWLDHHWCFDLILSVLGCAFPGGENQRYLSCRSQPCLLQPNGSQWPPSCPAGMDLLRCQAGTGCWWQVLRGNSGVACFGYVWFMGSSTNCWPPQIPHYNQHFCLIDCGSRWTLLTAVVEDVVLFRSNTIHAQTAVPLCMSAQLTGQVLNDLQKVQGLLDVNARV